MDFAKELPSEGQRFLQGPFCIIQAPFLLPDLPQEEQGSGQVDPHLLRAGPGDLDQFAEKGFRTVKISQSAPYRRQPAQYVSQSSITGKERPPVRRESLLQQGLRLLVLVFLTQEYPQVVAALGDVQMVRIKVLYPNRKALAQKTLRFAELPPQLVNLPKRIEQSGLQQGLIPKADPDSIRSSVQQLPGRQGVSLIGLEILKQFDHEPGGLLGAIPFLSKPV